jgi:acyl-CoA dehydrogenase
MDLLMTEEEVRFRNEVRTFLDGHLDDDLKRAERLNPSFLADPAIGLKCWAAPSWPKQYGGTGWTLAERYIFDQECERAGEPHFRGASIKMIAPVIMRYGNEAQKSFYLSRILSGEDLWAQGYSEPGSGSDLASLKSRAVLDGDQYIVNGSKIWSTLAHHATRMFALVRTADTGKKQEGITFILIDLTSPGVTIRPIRSICGTHEFNQVFFDDVKVPVSDRIGEEGEGQIPARIRAGRRLRRRSIAGYADAPASARLPATAGRANDDRRSAVHGTPCRDRHGCGRQRHAGAFRHVQGPGGR